MPESKKQYKIIVREITTTEYEETTTVYECSDGKKYRSKYAVPDGEKAREVVEKTGRMLDRVDEVDIYMQVIEDGADIKKLAAFINSGDEN